MPHNDALLARGSKGNGNYWLKSEQQDKGFPNTRTKSEYLGARDMVRLVNQMTRFPAITPYFIDCTHVRLTSTPKFLDTATKNRKMFNSPNVSISGMVMEAIMTPSL